MAHNIQNCIFLLLALFGQGIIAKKVTNIYWNTTTMAAEQPDGQPKLVVVNQGNKPTQYDQVNLICPVYKPGVRNTEKHIIYSVDKDEFDSCRVTNPRPRIVAICNRPQTFMYFTITFRSFTPTPGGLEFRPGKDYYFISTSNSKDIHRRVGGWCSSHNMRMIFRVAENDPVEPVASNEQPLIKPLTPPRLSMPVTTSADPTPTAFWSKYWNAHVPGRQENYIHDTVPTFADSLRRRNNDNANNRPFIPSTEKVVYLPREVDESVDITITASALSSAAGSNTLQHISTVFASITAVLMLSVILS